MIYNESDIKHSLAHIQIGDAVIVNTIESDRFSDDALDTFFRALRSGYAATFSKFTTRHSFGNLSGIIGDAEHNELDEYGLYGKFAGRIAIRESGLAIVERELHHETTESPISVSLRQALKHSVSQLMQFK